MCINENPGPTYYSRNSGGIWLGSGLRFFREVPVNNHPGRIAGAVEALEITPYEKTAEGPRLLDLEKRDTRRRSVVGKGIIVGGCPVLHGGAHRSTLGPMSTFPKRKHSHFN